MMSYGLKSALSFAAISVLVGCGTGTAHRVQRVPVSRLAPEKIEDSFSVSSESSKQKTSELDKSFPLFDSSTPFTSVQGSTITIKKDAIGKAFLLTPTIFIRDNMPAAHLVQPKIVSFEKNGQQLGLFELNQYAVYDELPSAKLLQTLPIDHETEEGISFKWDYGLAAIPLTFASGAYDIPATLIEMISADEKTFPSVSSFLSKAVLNDGGLDLEQVSRLRLSALSFNFLSFLGAPSLLQAREFTVQLSMRIAPYRSNPNFKPRLSAIDQGLGLFEIPRVRKEDGGFDLLAVRWDLSPSQPPLKYVISKGVPKELVKAVSEGVLYWNRVAGRKIVEVETGGNPADTPQRRRIPIFWTPWRQAAVARAAEQPDPLTGEILNASIFITTSFNNYGQICANQNKSTEGPATTSQQFGMTPSQFQLSPTCLWSSDPHQMAFRELRTLDSSPIKNSSSQVESTDNPPEVGPSEQSPVENSARKDEIVHDYVRLAIAHEVGHTLGFRHNFAGSLDSELPSSLEHFKEWQAYLKDGTHPGAAISSTVMEYPNGRDSFLLGAWLNNHVLPYDQAVFQWAYSDNPGPISDLKLPHFCTDMEGFRMNTLGCAPFDSGRDPLVGFAQDLAINRFGMSTNLLDSIVSRVHPDFEADKMTVRQAVASLNLDRFSSGYASYFRSITQVLSDEGRSLLVDRLLDGENWLNEGEYKEKTLGHLAQSMGELGGLPKLFQMAFKISDEHVLQPGWLLQDLEETANHADFSSGKTYTGTEYQLSEEDLASIKSYLPQIATRIENNYLRDLLIEMTGGISGFSREQGGLAILLEMMMGRSRNFASGIASESWQEPLGKIANQILTETDGEVTGTLDQEQKSVPKPKFLPDVRLAAVRLFSKEIFKKEEWLTKAFTETSETLRERMLLLASIPAHSSKVITIADGIQGTFQTTSSGLPSIEGKRLSPELKIWFQTELAILKALKEMDVATPDSMASANEALARSMLGLSFNP